MSTTKIEWADAVWNPVTGCTKISDGCKFCFAERMARRLAGRCGYPADDPFGVTFHENHIRDPQLWKKPRRIFVCSMGDLFHADVKEEWIEWVFAIMEATQRHTYMVLTKRPDRLFDFVSHPTGKHLTRGNVGFGVSVEDQATADRRIPYLLKTPAAWRFVSYEPALGPVDFSLYFGEAYEDPDGGRREDALQYGLDWLIAGGETGPGARPAHPDWFRSVRDQCQAASVPFFFKQCGDAMMSRITVGPMGQHRLSLKELKPYSRMLDGRTWDEFPEVMR